MGTAAKSVPAHDPIRVTSWLRTSRWASRELGNSDELRDCVSMLADVPTADVIELLVCTITTAA